MSDLTPRAKLLDRILAPWRTNGHNSAAPTNGKAAVPATGVQFVGSPDWRQVIRLDGSGAAPQATELDRATAFATSAYCYTAMLWRAQHVSEPPLMVVLETEDGKEWQPNHPLAELFDEPRPDLDMGEILSRTMLYRDLTGGALWKVAKDLLLRQRQVTPYSGVEFKTFAADGLIYGRYQVLTSTGSWQDVPREDVIHFREQNPFSWRGCLSRVDVAMAQLNLGHSVQRMATNFLRRAFFPGGLLTPDPEWHPTEEEWELWKATVEQWYGGPANAGAPLALPGGTGFSRTSSGMTDLLPSELLDRVEATVGSVFGTPPVVMGWLTGLQNSPWSQMAEARRQAIEDTIQPLWTDFEKRMSRALLTTEERKSGLMVRFDTSEVRALATDEERSARIAQTNSSHWTVDEMRLYTGQSKLPDGDERGNMIPGLVGPAPAADIGAGGTAPPKSADNKSSDTRDLLWMVFDLHTKSHEGTWLRVIAAHLDALKGDMIAAMQENVKCAAGPTAAFTDDERKAHLADVKETSPHWIMRVLNNDKPKLVAKTYPLIVKTGGSGVQRVAGRLKLSFSVLEPGLLKYAKREAGFLADVMGKTTGTAVARAVQKGLEAGETVAALTKRLEDLPAFDRDRAKMVARTETTRAWNGAQRASLSEFSSNTGTEVFKSWLSARDDRVRDEHAALDDGSEIGIDEVFDNGLTEPGEPNCRCSLVYRVAQPGESAVSIDEPSEVTE